VPEQIWRYSVRLKDKLLFSSDYPLISPERWLKEFKEINIPDEIKRKILKENAKRILNI
jgi:predicted TIM-barrel fold metal-dependent hydrolase